MIVCLRSAIFQVSYRCINRYRAYSYLSY